MYTYIKDVYKNPIVMHTINTITTTGVKNYIELGIESGNTAY